MCEAGQRSGDFEQIDSYAECRSEIQQAATFIHAKIKPAWPSLLAYPWGQASPYLRETYLPAHHTAHRMRAAFGGERRLCERLQPTLGAAPVCLRVWRLWVDDPG